jgi:hypothetical protein
MQQRFNAANIVLDAGVGARCLFAIIAILDRIQARSICKTSVDWRPASMRTLRLGLALFIAMAADSSWCLAARAVTIPYDIGLSPSLADGYAIYNPLGPGGLTTPVETFQAIVASAVDGSGAAVPVRLVLESPLGTTPASSAMADFYYDGPADAFPATLTLTAHLTFTAYAGPLGTVTQAYSDYNYNSYVFIGYNSPAPPTIEHLFQSTVGAGQPGLVLQLPYYEPVQIGLPRSFDHIYTLSHAAGVAVDRSLPIIHVAINVVGTVPEPDTALLACIGMALVCGAYRLPRQRLTSIDAAQTWIAFLGGFFVRASQIGCLGCTRNCAKRSVRPWLRTTHRRAVSFRRRQ